MSIKVAFVGFRHGHIGHMYKVAHELDYVEVAACVEEDPQARDGIPAQLGVELTHETFEQVLCDVEFDVLATGDYYARRGSLAIQALEAGKHVVSDKPLCTSMDELRVIARLARQKSLHVGIDLTMRYSPVYATMASIVQDGGIGEIASCMVTGLHPMNYQTGRPMWYFEEGKHGGTINDLMIHGVDLLRWATGREFTTVIAAEAWNHRCPVPFFQDSAQVMYEMDNGAKYLGDCSYMTPEGSPEPWRFMLWGSEGKIIIDGRGEMEWVRAHEGPQEYETITLAVNDPFEDFVSAVANGTERLLPNEECFRSQMAALAGQAAADNKRRDMPVPTI